MPPIHQKVILAGVCRNVAASIEQTLKKLRETAALFSDYRILIYENNSTDGTKKKLQSSNTEKLILKCENFCSDELLAHGLTRTWNYQPFRVEQISNARNKVLDMIASDAVLSEFDYLLWIDLDFTEWDIPALENCFSYENWDVITANGVLPNGSYRDAYAFRDKRYAFGPEIFGDYWWKKISPAISCKLDGKQLRPVYSAFGGMAIYRLPAIRNCRYSAHVTAGFHEENKKLLRDSEFSFFEKRVLKKLASRKVIGGVLQGIEYFNDGVFYVNNSGTNFPVVCEHVVFHYQMRQLGFDRIFVNPQLKVYC